MALPISNPVLIVALAMAIFLIAPLLMQRLRLPGMIGMIIAGAIFGPNALNVFARNDTIILLGTVGLLYLMFLAGAEIDLHGFKRHRKHSLIFGAITFFCPQILGTGIGLLLGYNLVTSILLASMFASHTLIAYPIAIRFGIAKSRSVTTAVGGTIITDTAALLVLSVIAASTRGVLDTAFWIRLVVFLSIYMAIIWFGLPRLGRWFLRHARTGAISEYVFVLAALFGGAFLAEVAGIEALVGAFFVGLALNRLIPQHSLLENRLRFVGEAIFIPFFLFSVGMLVDMRVLASDFHVWQVMIGMTVGVTATKWLAAKLAQKLCGYAPEEGWILFGLSVPQAAATLAATMVGISVGLFDEAVLSGAIMMILFTCIAGPYVVEKYGRQIALQEEQKSYEPGEAPQRILIPMANPATAEALIHLALSIREPDSGEPIYPVTVIRTDDEQSGENVTRAEKMLGHAVAHAVGADVPVVPLIRMDHNFANGIVRGIAETRTTTVIIGWDGKRSHHQGVFGTVLDQLLEQSKEQVLVAKLGHPLNITERIVLVVPQGADHLPGYPESVRTVKRMTSRLGAALYGLAVGCDAKNCQEQFDAVSPAVPTQFEHAEGWTETLHRLEASVRKNDFVVVLGARRGTVSWNPALDHLPGRLADMVPESFLMLYPSEVVPYPRASSAKPELPNVLLHVMFNIPPKSYQDVLRDLAGMAFASDPKRLQHIADALVESAEAFAVEICSGVVLVHARFSDISHSLVLLGISREGVAFPQLEKPARLVFALLTPRDMPGEHLARLAEIAALVSDPARLSKLMAARAPDDLKDIAFFKS